MKTTLITGWKNGNYKSAFLTGEWSPESVKRFISRHGWVDWRASTETRHCENYNGPRSYRVIAKG